MYSITNICSAANKKSNLPNLVYKLFMVYHIANIISYNYLEGNLIKNKITFINK